MSDVKAEIDARICTGHGRCYDLAPEIFAADDEGYGQVLIDDIPAKFEALATRAAQTCPERAISLGPSEEEQGVA